MSIVVKQMRIAYRTGIYSALFNTAFSTDTGIYISKGEISSEGIWGKLA